MNNLIRAAQRQDDAVVTNPAHQCVARKVESSESRLSQLQTHFSSLGILIILWLSAGLIWYCTCRSIQTPRIFGDELNYWDMARGFHQGAKIPYWSVNYDMPTLLYSFVISPVFAFHRLVDA